MAMRGILIGYGIAFMALLYFVLCLIGFIRLRRRKKMHDELKETISFTHGLTCDDYETQANKYGLTLGENAEHFAKMKDAMCRLRMNGYVADSEMDKITKRIHKDLVANLRKLEEEK